MSQVIFLSSWWTCQSNSSDREEKKYISRRAAAAGDSLSHSCSYIHFFLFVLLSSSFCTSSPPPLTLLSFLSSPIYGKVSAYTPWMPQVTMRGCESLSSLGSVVFRVVWIFFFNFLTSAPLTNKSHNPVSHHRMTFQNHLCLEAKIMVCVSRVSHQTPLAFSLKINSWAHVCAHIHISKRHSRQSPGHSSGLRNARECQPCPPPQSETQSAPVGEKKNPKYWCKRQPDLIKPSPSGRVFFPSLGAQPPAWCSGV